MRAIRIIVVVVAVVAVVAAGVVPLLPKGGAAASAMSMPVDAQPMIVLQVLSGDTVVMSSELPGAQVTERGQVTAKLLSINSPNLGIVPECYAIEAQGRLNELLPKGSVAWVATDVVPQDDNGRWLMNVWAADGRYVNYLLAVDGFAVAQEMPPNGGLWNPVERAGASAAARFGGLWGECR